MIFNKLGNTRKPEEAQETGGALEKAGNGQRKTADKKQLFFRRFTYQNDVQSEVQMCTKKRFPILCLSILLKSSLD